MCARRFRAKVVSRINCVRSSECVYIKCGAMVKSHTLRLRTVAPYRETGNARLASHLNLAATWSSHKTPTKLVLNRAFQVDTQQFYANFSLSEALQKKNECPKKWPSVL